MLLLVLYYLISSSEAKKLPDVYWNSTNSLLERYVSIGDAMDIICPYYDQNDVEFTDTEQSIIYRVSESDYETCTLSTAARELGRCISPLRRDKVKVSFRLLSPNPSALDYRPGHTYYFITTSTGTPWGLDNRKGGLCSTHQLKMIIHVGDYGHHHHRHHKPTTTTAQPPAQNDLDWPADPLWTNLIQKVEAVGNTILSTVTRGERVTLDVGNERHEYESVPLDELDFQIHEIGDDHSVFLRAEDFLQKPHCSKSFDHKTPNATRVKRDWRRNPYLGYQIHFGKRIHEGISQFEEPYVEYSLNKNKRWNEIQAIIQSAKAQNSTAIVTLSTPKRGCNWWDTDGGLIDATKLDDRLVSRAAQKGKSKNMTLVSICGLDGKPTLHFSVVRCYNDTHYDSQLLKYRRRLQHQKRRSYCKYFRRPYMEEDLVLTEND
ncbi:unnamed protein product [Cylicocyclus nassatus]|uniref:Ephrin RBD domain-containing protein n=1 Tax=Cylicocyclus nassatus TaxID=53992 RepID=A0AA36H4J3_CYLNA|nr:unnamed protein product [Cylicocyclus nassatus]